MLDVFICGAVWAGSQSHLDSRCIAVGFLIPHTLIRAAVKMSESKEGKKTNFISIRRSYMLSSDGAETSIRNYWEPKPQGTQTSLALWLD